MKQGDDCNEKGNFTVAAINYEKSFNLRSRISGADDTTVIETAHKLADVYQKQGKYPSAEKYLDWCLKAQAQRFGAGSYEFAETQSAFGDFYMRKKDYAQAIEKYEQVLTLTERYKGAESELTMKAKRDLARAYLKSGDRKRFQEIMEPSVVAQRPRTGSRNDSEPDRSDD